MNHKLTIGYAAEHEQHDPNLLLKYAVMAEKENFDAVWSSDHFHPWAHTGASCGFAWVWMASLAERTKTITIGTGVTTPTLRYHPAIVAQAFATLGVMYPDRIFLGLGSGVPLNEVPLGYSWPHLKERVEMFDEAIKVIKLLWSENFVNFRGKYYHLSRANLYTRPAKLPKIYIAAFTTTIAETIGKYADGVLTGPYRENAVEYFKSELFPAIEKAAREHGRNPYDIEKAIEIPISYDEDYDKALESTRFWAATLLPATLKYPMHDPREIEEHGRLVGKEHLARLWIVVDNINDAIKKVEDYIKAGFTNIHFLSSSPSEEKFVHAFGEKAIPYLREVYDKE